MRCGLGFFRRPERGRLPTYFITGAVFGLAAVATLSLLAKLQRPSGAAHPAR